MVAWKVNHEHAAVTVRDGFENAVDNPIHAVYETCLSPKVHRQHHMCADCKQFHFLVNHMFAVEDSVIQEAHTIVGVIYSHDRRKACKLFVVYLLPNRVRGHDVHRIIKRRVSIRTEATRSTSL